MNDLEGKKVSILIRDEDKSKKFFGTIIGINDHFVILKYMFGDKIVYLNKNDIIKIVENYEHEK